MHRALMIAMVMVLTIIFQTASAATTIKLAVVTKPGSAQNIVAERFKALLEAQSQGDIKIKIFHSGSRGNETDILTQIQKNIIQMGVITAGPFDSFDPIVRVLHYPFLFKDSQEADRILDGPLGDEILASLEESGFKGLCYSENGFRNLTNNSRPVQTPGDVKGLRIRVMESAVHKAIWRTLGANPMPMPWPIYTELKQGVVDGQENPLWVVEVYRFYEIQKYLTLTRHVYSPNIDVASLSWWKTLDPRTRELIQKCMVEAARFQRKDFRGKDAVWLKLLKEKGMLVQETPDIESFRAKVAGMKDMDLFRNPRVKAMLEKLIQATQ